VTASRPVAIGKVVIEARERAIPRTDVDRPWAGGLHPVILVHPRCGKGVEGSPGRRLAPVLRGPADRSPMTPRIVPRWERALRRRATV